MKIIDNLYFDPNLTRISFKENIARVIIDSDLYNREKEIREIRDEMIGLHGEDGSLIGYPYLGIVIRPKEKHYLCNFDGQYTYEWFTSIKQSDKWETIYAPATITSGVENTINELLWLQKPERMVYRHRAMLQFAEDITANNLKLYLDGIEDGEYRSVWTAGDKLWGYIVASNSLRKEDALTNFVLTH